MKTTVFLGWDWFSIYLVTPFQLRRMMDCSVEGSDHVLLSYCFEI